MLLNNVSLEGISPLVRIVDIIETPPKRRTHTVDRPKYNGLFFIGQQDESREIEILFDIKAKTKAVRRALLDTVLTYFDRSGKLELPENRPDHYLNVVCTEAPSLGSIRDYADTLSMTYTSYGPYWLANSPVTASLSYAHDPEPATIVDADWKWMSITPSGSADNCFLEFSVTNDEASAAMDDLVIATVDKSFVFTDLELGAGETLVCAYNADGFLSLAIDGTSVMDKRTGSDDIILTQRTLNTVGIRTIKAATVTLSARGLWK